MNRQIILDTETTGLPKRWDAPLSDSENWPRCIQIAWQLHNERGGMTFSRKGAAEHRVLL